MARTPARMKEEGGGGSGDRWLVRTFSSRRRFCPGAWSASPARRPSASRESEPFVTLFGRNRNATTPRCRDTCGTRRVRDISSEYILQCTESESDRAKARCRWPLRRLSAVWLCRRAAAARLGGCGWAWALGAARARGACLWRAREREPLGLLPFNSTVRA